MYMSVSVSSQFPKGSCTAGYKQAYKPKKEPAQEQPTEDNEKWGISPESTKQNERKEEPIVAHKEPYEISPQEFGSRKGYDSVQLRRSCSYS